MTNADELAPATSTVQEDNARVRVTEWRFPPGSHTGWHVHEFDYVVVPMTTGSLRIISRDGTADFALNAGRSYYRQAGVEHDVTNVTDREVVFVETEIKAHPLQR
jgi:quercetin dioxygenase-like cupin family protein